MKEKIIKYGKIVGIAIGIFVLMVCFIWMIKGCERDRDDEKVYVKSDTVYVTKVDTVRIEHEVVRYKPQPMKTDTVMIVLPTNDSVIHVSKVYEIDSCYVDSLDAKVDYKLHVRTYDNDIDSIGLKFDLTYPKVVETQTITKVKKKHFNHGISVGVGYGLINRKPDVFVGYTITYSF